MDKADPTPGLIRGLQADDPQAAETLFRRYADRLVRLAEAHLSRRLAGRIDGEDVVQSVFRTFFRRGANGEFRIDTSAHLWRLLVTITVRKAQAHGRRHSAGRRHVAAELPGGHAGLGEAPGRDPGPAEAAMLVDQIEALLQGLPPLYGEVLRLRLEGHAVADIAPQLGVSRQTVYRTLNLLGQRLERASSA
jgi:RNA polymerase sigma-70 factor (ECF subfamily)